MAIPKANPDSRSLGDSMSRQSLSPNSNGLEPLMNKINDDKKRLIPSGYFLRFNYEANSRCIKKL